MYRFKKKIARKKREVLTSLNSLTRNAHTFRKLSLTVQRITKCLPLSGFFIALAERGIRL